MEQNCIKPKKKFCNSPCIPIRYIFTLMGFLGFVTLYTLRVNLNVAIVAMVNGTAAYNQSNDHECPLQENTTSRRDSQEGEFDWSPQLQGFVLGSFFYGYCITQIPGGRLSEMFGAKWIFGIGTLCSSLMTLLTPIAARRHVSVLIGLRVVEGLAQGVTLPSMHSMLGQWLPETEKGFLSTIVYNGMNIGTVVGMATAGVLCDSDLFGGWPSAFYVFGFVGCLWFLVWIILVSNTPADHPWISNTELEYITENQRIEHLRKPPAMPWVAILSSGPVWALILTSFGQDWAFYIFLTDTPTFLGTILHFDIKENGLLSSIPLLAQAALACLVSFLADMAIRKQIFSVNFVRKFCTSVASFGRAFCLVGVCLSGCDVTTTVYFYAASNVIVGFVHCGYMISHLDIAPEYAGTLMGLTNTAGSISGFIAPAVVGSLTEHSQTLHQWRIVFYIAVALLITSNTIFVVFGSTQRQQWTPVGREHAILKEEEEEDSFHNKLSQKNRIDYGTLSINADKSELSSSSTFQRIS